jgi:ubiquinone/menaquinone biosynthesis C-methylase UbiE
VDHWSQYWQNTSSVNSFGEGEYKDGYDGELASLWEVFIDTWKVNSKVLDLGTGNGGLALLCVNMQPNIDMYACDAADIKPSEILNTALEQFKGLENIQFIGNQKIEDLAFEDEFFDHIISQFGLEYSEFNSSLKAIYRTLSKGGSCSFMMHNNNSFVTHNSATGLKVLSYFLKSGGVLDLLKDFIGFCQQTLDNHQDNSSLHTFNILNKELLQAFKSIRNKLTIDEEIEWFNDVSNSLVVLVQNWRTTRLDKVTEIEQSLLYFRQRLNEQVSVAQNNAQMIENLDYCKSLGFEGNFIEVKINEGVMGWMLSLHKNNS